MVEDVLAVRHAVLEPAEQVDQLRVEAGHTDLQNRPFTRVPHALVHLAERLFVGLLDAGRVDAAILYEPPQSATRDLAPHRVECRKSYRLRCVVNDDVHACRRFERSDVAPLPSDDPPLHFVAGKLNHGHRRLSDHLRREALHGRRQNAPRSSLRLFTRLELHITHQHHGVAPGVVLDALHQLLLGGAGVEACQRLQLGSRLFHQLVSAAPCSRDLLLPVDDVCLALRQIGGALLQRSLPLTEPLLSSLQFHASMLKRLFLALPICIRDGPRLTLSTLQD